jgi:hypothetical protein
MNAFLDHSRMVPFSLRRGLSSPDVFYHFCAGLYVGNENSLSRIHVYILVTWSKRKSELTREEGATGEVRINLFLSASVESRM